jgi:hypothetical protein
MVDVTKYLPEDLNNRDWWRLNTALAHYGGYTANTQKEISAFAYLVCQAMSMSTLPSIKPNQIKALLKTEFGGDWQIGEINEALKELKNIGSVAEIPDNSGTRYSVISDLKEENRKILKETAELGKKVVEDWIQNVRKRHSEFNDNDCKVLTQDLLDFSVNIFDRYGVECAALLYPGETKREEFLKLIANEDIPSLQDRQGLNGVRDTELLDFFRCSEGDRSIFIGYFLKSSFLKNAISIDPKFIGIISKHFEGSIVVLDTNFLFALLGLEGSFDEEIAKACLQFTRALGIGIQVHQVSVREFRRSLNRRGQEVKSGRMPTIEITKVLRKLYRFQGPVSAYYDRYTTSGVGWDDWARTYVDAIETRLSEYGITVTRAYEEQIYNDEKLEELAKDVFNKSKDYYLTISGGHSLNMDICRHDAFLLLFIKKLREGKPEEFVGAKRWVVSLDSKMPRYERISQDSESHNPFDIIPTFILVDHWLQFIGPMNPKTQDWDMLARSLILSPYLQAPALGGVSIEKIHAVANRISEYKNLNAQLATQVLLNSRFKNAMESMNNEQFAANIGDLLEESLLEEYYENHDTMKKTAAEKVELEKQKIELEKQNQELVKMNQLLETSNTTITGKNNELTSNINDLKSNLKKTVNRTYAILIGIILVIASAMLNWKNLNILSFTLVIIGWLAGILGIIGLLKNWKLAWQVFTIITAVLSIAAAIITFRISQ